VEVLALASGEAERKLYQAIESFSEIGRNDTIKRAQSKLVCICRAGVSSQFPTAKLAKIV
jgi:hypothetical protein